MPDENRIPLTQPHEGSIAREREARLIARLLVSLISLTLVGLGLFAVFTQHYYGSTNKLGGAVVSLWGTPAVLMGLSTVFLGMAPLALWFASKKAAGLWATGWVAAAAVTFVIAYRSISG